MPTGSLPPKGARLWDRVYKHGLEQGRSKESAASIAWHVVKQAGYRQDASGKWHAPYTAAQLRKGKHMAKKKTKKSGMARSVRVGKSGVVPMTHGQKARKRREKKLLVVGKHVIEV